MFFAALMLGQEAASAQAIRFAPPVFLNSGDSANGVALADLNGDAKLDLVINKGVDLSVADRADANVTVMLGNGDGTFGSPVTYAIPNLGTSWPVAMAVGDFDGDGKVDVAVALASSGTSGGNVLVYGGNGDGTLKAPISSGTRITAFQLQTADLNNDGKADLIVAGNGSQPLLLSNGDGTFNAASVPPGNIGCEIFSMAAGDFNGDGRLDMAAACSVASPGGFALVYIQNADGTFQAPVSYQLNDFSNTLTATSITIGDLNGDGKPDLILGESYVNTAQVLLGNGDGTFTNTTDYYAGTGPAAIATADFNGDGSIDVAFADFNFVQNTDPQLADNFGLSTIEGNGDGTLNFTHSFAEWGPAIHANGLAVGDLNGDGASDVVLSDAASGKVAVMLNARAVNIDLTANPAQTLSGQSVTFTAKVFGTEGQAGIPTGTVDFYDYTLIIGSATLDASGTATFTTSFSGQVQEPAMPHNYHLIAAGYRGDANFVGSWTDYSLGVGDPVTVNFTATPNPAASGQTVTLTAQISSSYGTPTGSMNFFDGGTFLKNVKVTGNTATYAATFSDGNHVLKAEFFPDSNSPSFIGGEAKLTLRVAITPTTLTLSLPPSATVGAAVQISATVSAPSSGTPTGSVQFFDGGTSIGTAALAGGTATIAVTLGLGTHNIRAQYGGDTTFAAATSASNSLVVNPIATTTVLTGPTSGTAGTVLTITVTVSSSSGIPSGNVALLDNNTQLSVAALANGTASYNVQLTAGTHVFSAVYQGGGNFSASNSAALAVTVPADFMVATSANKLTVNAGASATTTITITPLPGGFAQAVQLLCAGLPDKSSCSFSPASVTPGSAAATSTITISTTATTVAMVPQLHSIYALALALPLFGTVLLSAGKSKSRSRMIMGFVITVGVAGMTSCGGGSTPVKAPTVTQPGTPAGNYTVLVTAQSGATQHQTSITLTVQ